MPRMATVVVTFRLLQFSTVVLPTHITIDIARC